MPQGIATARDREILMPNAVQSFLWRWFVTTLGVLVAASVVSGVRADTTVALLGASLILGILNAILRPFLIIISLPLVLLTLGLFTLVINAVLLYFVGDLVKGFFVADFWSAFKGGLVISIVSMLANVFGPGKKETRVERRPPPQPPDRRPPPPDAGSGPIIDV
jgi:putative membrane protein